MQVPNLEANKLSLSGLTNANIRVLSNGAIFVQYQQDGKAKDAAFPTWTDFIAWLTKAVGINTGAPTLLA